MLESHTWTSLLVKSSDDKQSQLSGLMQRIQLASEKSEPTPVSEGFRQEELASQTVASSSSQQWQTSQSLWSNWEWTPGHERWWEQSEWAQQPDTQEWQEPTVKPSPEAKRQAKAEKRAKQRVKKAEVGIDTSNFKL